MGKIVESLKILSPREELLHETIIDTYFYKKSRKKRRAKNIYKELKSLPLAVLALTAIITATYFANSFLSKHYNHYLKTKIERSRVVVLTSSGTINKEPVKRFEFRGHARNGSKIFDKTIFFNNPKKYAWADMSIDFKFPINFSDRLLSLSLKGRTGGEKVSVILRDNHNRSSVLSDIYLTSGWTTKNIPIDILDNDIDLANINHLRLESSYTGDPPKNAGASADVTVYIKDMRLSRKERTI